MRGRAAAPETPFMPLGRSPLDRLWLRTLALLVRAAYSREFRQRHERSLLQTIAADVTTTRGRVSSVRALAAAAAILRDGTASRFGGRSSGEQSRWRLRHALAGWRVDARGVMRSIRFQPWHAALVVFVLAIGVGAATAMFSVVDAVLLRPLPYPHGHALLRMAEYERTRNLSGVSLPALDEWSRFPSLARIAGYDVQHLLFTFGGTNERAEGVFVSPAFFETLGTQPALGRVMQPGAPLLDPQPKIVLSHALWLRQFGGDRAVIGRHVTLETRAYEIIGVMPPGFAFPTDAQFWTTMPTNMTMVLDARGLRFVDVIARLAPGRTVADAERDLADWSAKTASLLDEADRRDWRAEVRLLHDEIVGPVRPALRVTMIGVALLLLAACANVAALTLARGRARAASLALQSALGAGRGRLVRQQLIEVVVLAVAGGAGALLIAAAARRGIVALSIDQIPRIATVAIDARVFVFAFGCGVGAALAAAVGPALSLTRGVSPAVLQQATTRVSGSRARRRLFGGLVAAEFAFAVALVAGAGLLTSSYLHLKRVRTGIDPAGIGAASLNVPLTPAWRSDTALRNLVSDVSAGVRALPGITHAAFVARLPLDPVRGGVEIETRDPAQKVTTLYTVASEGYFATMGARVIAGRDFAPSDVDTAPPVAVINDELARRLFGEPARAIGQTVRFSFMRGPMSPTVVGVIEAIRYDGLRSALKPELYQSYRQAIVVPGTIVYRATEPPMSLVAGVRAALARADRSSTVTLEQWSTFEDRMSRAVAQPRFFLVLMAVFATAALLLAALGIHGTLSFWIAERRRELGIRQALGADRRAIARLVIGRGMTLAAIGIVCGLAISLAGGRFLAQILFQVTPGDPPTLIGAGIGLLALAAIVCAVPARRAARIDPIITLRGD